MRFRRATIDDVDQVVTLVESAYRGDSSRVGWTTEADLLEGQRTDHAGVTEAIRGAGSMMLVAEAGRLVACCQIEGRDDRLAHFGMFAVRPGMQGRGLGGLLLRQAEDVAARELGATTMRMTVIGRRPELIGWYERLGYARTGQRLPFPYGDERYGRPTVPDLEFVVLSRSLGRYPSVLSATGADDAAASGAGVAL